MIEPVWQSLLAQVGKLPLGGSFILQLVESAVDVRVFGALRASDQSPALVVSAPTNTLRNVHLPADTMAFGCSIVDLEGLPVGHRGVSIVLEGSAYRDLFALLAAEVQQCVAKATSAEQAVTAIGACVKRWQRFVQRRGGRALSDEEVRGLIGELAIVARLISKFGSRQAVVMWKGPLDALRDFDLPDACIEAKTYKASVGASIWINDPQQLDDAAIRPVYLGVSRLASATRGKNLPEFISAVMAMLQSEPEARDLFLQRLAEAGYMQAQEREYTQDRYVIEAVNAYKVEPGFPRIAASQVPPGVEKVRFSISIAAIQQWEVDLTPIWGTAEEPWGTKNG